MDHPDSSQYPEYAGTGQNMAKTFESKINITSFLTMWYREVLGYTFDTNKCQVFSICGHYTQVSEVLFCGIAPEN